MKLEQSNVDFLLQVTSSIWLEEWLNHHTYAANQLEAATLAGLNADFYSAWQEILLDWLDFLGVTVDQSNLVSAIAMEWGGNATRSESVSGSEVDCIPVPRNENEGHKVAAVHIAGMPVESLL